MIQDLIICDRARIPIAWLVTHEELRAEAEIVKYANDNKAQVWIWSLNSNPEGGPGWEPPIGMSNTLGYSQCPFDASASSAPDQAVNTFVDYSISESANKKIIAIFRDPHHFINLDPSFIRTLRDASRELRDGHNMIICISPEDNLPTDLHIDVVKIYPGLPDKDSIQQEIGSIIKDYDIINAPSLEEVTNACVGLTLIQVTDVLCKSLVKYREIQLDFVREEKTKVISSKPGLSYIRKTPSIEQVGGLDCIKGWLKERKKGFSQEAREQNLPFPRGILCIGIPGAGKSLFAKATSSYLGMPLIKLNPPDLKGSLVGQTESNFRQAREAIDSLGHCVVWIDELEKSISGNTGKNLDGGTSDALLQGFLHWMQEKEGGSFIVATANNLEALPPELLRKGRWDAIFFVDLPIEEERIEIFKIHLDRRNWVLKESEIKNLAKKTENYSGAEIEAACIDGKWKAFSEGRDLEAKDILSCIKDDVPLYVTMKEKILDLRKWARERARPASTKMSRRLVKKPSKKMAVVLDNVEKLN
jgi:hypothetical protein